MSLTLEIMHIFLPLVLVCGIAVFVVLRMIHKTKKGTLGKKKTRGAQNLLDSLIPLGMVIGFIAAIFVSLLLPIALLSSIAWGPGIGLLFGYFAYEIYSKKKEDYS